MHVYDPYLNLFKKTWSVEWDRNAFFIVSYITCQLQFTLPLPTVSPLLSQASPDPTPTPHPDAPSEKSNYFKDINQTTHTMLQSDQVPTITSRLDKATQ